MNKKPWGVLLAMIVLTSTPARAGTKEEIMRLQSDVLALQNQLRLLEKNFTDRMDGLTSLVTQLNDQLGKSTLLMSQVSATIENQASSGRSNEQALVQEVRNLASKIDDASTRISALAQQVSEMRTQTRDIAQRRFQSASADPNPSTASDSIFFEAYNDLIQGNLDLAIQGFSSFLNSYPTSEKADDAQYYIGEAYYNDKAYPEAVTAFSKVLTGFAQGDKAASALYKRGLAQASLQQKDSAVADFKTVVQKYPSAPEAALARSQLESIGADLSRPVRPNPGRNRP